jgi:outer membrane beta-barrel protein
MKHLILATILLASSGLLAGPSNGKVNVQEDIDTLGGNEDLIKMAQSLKSKSKARIVQERIIDRHNRFEIAASYGGIMGGDSYLQTQALGLAANFHITPRWSLGAEYTDYRNKLTSEGDRVFTQYRQSRAANGLPAYAVDVDYPLSSTMAVLNWYPIYGKTSFLDLGVTQFDIYMILGGGQIELSSGSSPIYSVGLGIGAWLTKHLALRTEVKYQTYTDQPITGERHLNIGTANIGMGFIL